MRILVLSNGIVVKEANWEVDHIHILLAVIMYGQLLSKPIKKLSTSMASIETSFSSIKRIFAVIDYQKDK